MAYFELRDNHIGDETKVCIRSCREVYVSTYAWQLSLV